MRETCARVLAAALMTGAVAFVVAMPALFAPEPDSGPPFAAPPSSLRRAVHVTAQHTLVRPAAERPQGAQTIVHTIRTPAAGARVTPRGSTAAGRLRPASAGRSEGRSPPAPAPAPTPAPAPIATPPPAPQAAPETDTRQLASAAPAAPALLPAAPAPTDGEEGHHGRGDRKDKKRGNDNERWKDDRPQDSEGGDREQEHGGTSCGVPATVTFAPTTTSSAAPVAGGDDHHGKGTRKDNGHDKWGDKWGDD
jgi:hypothetical protein